MPPYLWISTEQGHSDKDTKEEARRTTKVTKDEALRSEKEEDHNPIEPPTEIPHQEEHASSVGKWATSPGTAQRRGRRRASTSSTTTIMTGRSTSHWPPYQGTA